MGAYENPTIIRDRSGEIFGQAIANFGKSIAEGITRAAANRDALRRETEAERKRVQGFEYQIQQKQYKDKNANVKEFTKTGVPLTSQFQTLAGEAMLGVGKPGDENYIMGAIPAATALATDPNLSLDDKRFLQTQIDDSTQFQENMLQYGGQIKAELIPYNELPVQEYGNNFTFAGNTAYEKLGSQIAAAVLSNKEIPYATSTKELKRGKNNEVILTVKSLVNPDKTQLTGEFSDEKLYPRDANGNIEVIWSKDLSKGVNLINEIEEGIDTLAIAEESNIMTEGKMNKNQFVGGTTGRLEAGKIKGLPNYKSLLLEKIVDAGAWQNPNTPAGQELQPLLKGKAAGFLSLPPDQLQAYMSQRLGLSDKFDLDYFLTGKRTGGKDDPGSNILDEFMKNVGGGEKWTGSQNQQTAFLQNELFEEFLQKRTGQFQNRPATPQDIENGWAVKDPKTGKQTVYFQGTEQKIDGSKGKGSKEYNPVPVATKFTSDLKELGADGLINSRLNLSGEQGAKFEPAGDGTNNPLNGVISIPKIGDDGKQLKDDAGNPDFSVYDLRTTNAKRKVEFKRFMDNILSNDLQTTEMPLAEKAAVRREIEDQFRAIFNDVTDSVEETVYEKQFKAINAAVPDMKIKGFPTKFTTKRIKRYNSGEEGQKKADNINTIMKKFRDDIGKEITKVEDPKQFYDAMLNYYEEDDQSDIGKLFKGAVEDIISNNNGDYSTEIINKLKTAILSS